MNAIRLVSLIISLMILNVTYVMISYSECHYINVISNEIYNSLIILNFIYGYDLLVSVLTLKPIYYVKCK